MGKPQQHKDEGNDLRFKLIALAVNLFDLSFVFFFSDLRKSYALYAYAKLSSSLFAFYRKGK